MTGATKMNRADWRELRLILDQPIEDIGEGDLKTMKGIFNRMREVPKLFIGLANAITTGEGIERQLHEVRAASNFLQWRYVESSRLWLRRRNGVRRE